MPPVPPKKKTTPAQRFAQVFARFTQGATEGERASAEDKMDAWLKRHGKTRADIPAILAQAIADDAVAQPPPPPSDPRDTQPHPYEDPRFTPIGLVHGITGKYLWMAPHVAVIYSAWIVFTHVYPQFKIAPRLALVSKLPNSGKTVAVDVAKRLVLRPNAESFSTTAALEDFIKGGPCTIGLDELDLIGRDARRALLLLWNLGHKRGEKRALMEGKHREQHNLHAPMIAAGLGTFLAPASMTRTYVLEMEKYTEGTKPEREFDDTDTADHDKVYAYLRQWATRVKLNLKPPMPKGVIARDADNACGMVAVADACGPEWGQRVREAITFLLEKAGAERP